MNEYELQELAFSASGLGASFASMFITVISGYLVVAYLAGRELTRPQVTLVNAIFFVTSSLFLYGTISSFAKQLSMVDKLRALNPDNYYPLSTPIATAIAVTFAIIIIASLHFMWSVRHPKTK